MTPGAAPDGRLPAATAVLERAGVPGVPEEAGRNREIVAVRADARHLAALARLAPELRALGYRYVALQLGDAEPNWE